MSGSFSQQLQDLLNPEPKFADPEDDQDEATKARVVDRFSHEDDGGDGDDDGGLGLSVLRKSNTTLLSDTDRRYVGKTVTRKQLLLDSEGFGEYNDDDEEEEEEEVVEDEDGEAVESMQDQEDEEEEDEDNSLDDEEELGRNDGLAFLKSSEATFPEGVDFHKMTEGMDDLGVSEDDDDDDDGEEVSGEETEGSDEEAEASDSEDDGGTVQTFSKHKLDEEVEKGKAVKNQLALWDQLLEGRIKIQKALMTANQLPQPQTLPEFKKKGGAEMAVATKNAHKALKALQRSLLELHDLLLGQNANTKAIMLGKTSGDDDDDNEEIQSDEEGEGSAKKVEAPKRKLEMATYPDFMAKRYATFQPYQNDTLQKWHDKTRLSTGKSSKGFGAFDRNILTQVEHVLADQERLIRRTQTRRSEYRVLGKKESSALLSGAFSSEVMEVDAEQRLKANTHLKDLDEDIFDDDDFYHQLLRELIERKTSATDPNDQVAMGRQWLAIQKLRSKIKKKVDTKASKGRKVRFHVHSKLMNFMAPMDHSSMSDEARDELYRGLFGHNATVRE